MSHELMQWNDEEKDGRRIFQTEDEEEIHPSSFHCSFLFITHKHFYN